MIKDSTGTYYKLYDAPRRWNHVLSYMVEHMTNSNLGQLVNFGKTEKNKFVNAEKQLSELMEDNTIKHIADDLYMVNPYIFGNGEWCDVLNLQYEFDKEEYNRRYKVEE